jgi:hypothetical protein
LFLFQLALLFPLKSFQRFPLRLSAFETRMHYIQRIAEILTALHQIAEALKLLTHGVISCLGWVLFLVSLLRKHRL